MKPRIDAAYRTRKDRDSTVAAGSSMGGLISLYAFLRRPSPFGGAAVLSPSIWFGGREIVQENFKLVILAIIVISVLPAVVEFVRARRASKRGESALLELATVGEVKPEEPPAPGEAR